MKWYVSDEWWRKEDFVLFYGNEGIAVFQSQKIAAVVCRILNALKYNPFKKREISSHEK